MAAVPCVRISQQIWSCFRGHSALAFQRNLLTRQCAAVQSHVCVKSRDFSRSCATFAGDSSSTGDDSPSGATAVASKRFGLTFEEYVKKRGLLRRVKRLGGIPFGVLGIATNSVISVYLFPNMFDEAPEQVELIMGLDPLMFCGITGVVGCGIGYVIGGAVVGSIWKYFNKELADQILERETDFLSRLNQHRFDSVSKFEDDYYGEKIKNLSDYRQWVRTQQKRRRDTEKYEKKNTENKEEKS